MNKYRVKITRKDNEEFSHKESEDLVSLLIERGMRHYFLDSAMYIKSEHDLAMETYACAKRNLDPKKYMVTLELPGKEEMK